jgi:PAS domain S-box-containing protein
MNPEDFEHVFQDAAVGISVTDKEGRFIQANQAYCCMVNYTQAELLQMRFSEITHPEDQEPNAKMRRRLLREEIPSYVIHKRYIAKGGRVVWVRLSVSLVRDSAGEVMGSVAVAEDITHQRATEEALRRSQAMLQSASRLGKLGGWTVDLRNAHLFWTDEVYRIHEAPPDYVPTVEEAIHFYAPEYRALIQEVFTACAEEGIPYDEELQIITTQGQRVWVRTIGQAVRNEEGEIVEIEGAFQDISERKRLEAQLLRAQRMESIGTLAGGIAHDLNNVLSPILLSVPLLRQSLTSERDLRRLTLLNESAQRGAELVRQVLAFARGAQGQRIPIQVDEVVQDVVRLLRETLDKNIIIEQQMPEQTWTVRGDPTQLHQVLVNLCVNARDAMPAGGTLSISVANLHLDGPSATIHPDACPGTYVQLTVADNGNGIPTEIVDRIFDPFFTTKPIGEGTGLGLATVQGIVKGHGGFITVYSELDHGTAFRIYLPAQPNPSLHGQQHDQQPTTPGQGELILVVDDEPAVRTAIQHTLESYGYRAVLAEDGAEALSIYAQQGHQIAAVLTDMMMPVMDGLATIHALIRLNPHVRIIAASGLMMNDTILQARTAGACDFLSKPFTAEALLHALNTALSKS